MGFIVSLIVLRPVWIVQIYNWVARIFFERIRWLETWRPVSCICVNWASLLHCFVVVSCVIYFVVFNGACQRWRQFLITLRDYFLSKSHSYRNIVLDAEGNQVFSVKGIKNFKRFLTNKLLGQCHLGYFFFSR